MDLLITGTLFYFIHSFLIHRGSSKLSSPTRKYQSVERFFQMENSVYKV